jgi:hypothetical protein
LGHHFAQIDQSVSHTPQGRIDAAVGKAGDILKAHIGIVAQHNDLSLVLGKL